VAQTSTNPSKSITHRSGIRDLSWPPDAKDTKPPFWQPFESSTLFFFTPLPREPRFVGRRKAPPNRRAVRVLLSPFPATSHSLCVCTCVTVTLDELALCAPRSYVCSFGETPTEPCTVSRKLSIIPQPGPGRGLRKAPPPPWRLGCTGSGSIVAEQPKSWKAGQGMDGTVVDDDDEDDHRR
jgi:hypothetical protein